MHADHSVVLARLGEQIAQLRISIASAQQAKNRAVDDREHRRCTEIIRQRRTELALWYDICEFAQNNTAPSEQATEQVRADTADRPGTRPSWLYGQPGPAFTDAPERMMRVNAERRLAEGAGLVRPADMPHYTSEFTHGEPKQHPH